MAPSAARLQKVLSPEGSELSQFLPEAQGALSSQRQRSEPCYGTQVLNVKRLVHHHPGARIAVQILLTRPATVLSFFCFSMFHENICIVISSFFHQNTTENFPSTFPTGVCQKFIPPKKTPQKTVAPLLVQGPHHIVLMRWGFSSTPLKATASPENGTHFNRRFLPFEIFRLNLQGPFWKTWGDLWFHEHSRLIFAQVKVAPGFRVCLWFGIDRFLFKSLFFKIDNTFFFWEKKNKERI